MKPQDLSEIRNFVPFFLELVSINDECGSILFFAHINLTVSIEIK
jgi:hypothetical protein